MAEKKTAEKTVNYRRCEISPKPSQNLQQLMGAALHKFAKPGERYEPLNAQSSELRCIGLHYTSRSCLCGFLTSFERGAPQPVVADDPAAASLRLGALAPPPAKKGAPQDQFVPGVLYFVVHKNHVALVQSHSMRDGAFERHLNWLLKSRTSEVPATSTFALSNEAQKATKAKIRQSHVKAIAFGQPLMSPVEVPVTAPVAATGRAATKKKMTERKFKPEGFGLEMLRSLLSDGQDFEKLGLDGVFDGNVEIWLEIRYPKRQRTKPEDAVHLMDTLGVALRDAEGDQVELRLADGSRVTGKELRITGKVETPTLANRLPDERKLLESMVDWLQAQIDNAVIDP